MRPGALAVVAVVSALLGGTAALVVAQAVGLVGETETVVVPGPAVGEPAGQDGAARPAASREAAKPLPGNGFDPALIYRERAAGVVTVYAFFGEGAAEAPGGAAQGSGFVVSADGYVLTNSHVVTTAGEGSRAEEARAGSPVFVQFADGDRVEAEVVGWDVYDDVALLKVDPEEHELSPVPLGDSSEVVVGEPVAAIGSPFGNEGSLAVGVVSATERSIASLTSCYSLSDAIQTDAPINPGNSGGPMFDARGNVIGINAQIRSESGLAEGVGFAVPINTARRSMEQLIASGEVRYAWVGVTTQSLTPSLARRFGYPVERGAAVQSVVPSSPADRAGLRGGEGEEEFEGIRFARGGDVILSIDGAAVESADDLVRAVAQQLAPGQTVRLTVLRNGARRTVPVLLGERPRVPPGSDDC